jgi:hypothetical protein
MRVSDPLSLILPLCVLCAEGLAAQSSRPLGPPAGAFRSAAYQTDLRPETDLPPEEGATWKRRLLTGLGSAALGAGAGFFASQVTHSDWADVPGQNQANRGLWAALGGGVGLAFGVSFPLGAHRPTHGLPSPSSLSRSTISLAEIRDASVDNAYDIVRLLRPEWLRVRPQDRLGELQPNSVSVYLDEFRYGDITSLSRIHVQTIATIRFVPAATATARWGTGHTMGVIQIITVG